jgi:hypothetical protein
MLRLIPQAEFSNVEVSPDEVWRYLGYPNSNQASPAIQKVFHQAMEVGLTLLEPVACYDIFQIGRVTSSSVEVEGGVSFDSRDLALRHRKAKELAAFIITIGPRVEEEATKLIQGGNSVLGYVLDMFGSAAVDTMAYRVRELIQDYALSKGYQALTRGTCIGNDCLAYKDCGGVIIYWWSPGYGDWDTREQKKLFTIVDGSHIGVHLTESCMMTPRKSYTCVLPIGPQGEKSPKKCVEGKREWTQRGLQTR